MIVTNGPVVRDVPIATSVESCGGHGKPGGSGSSMQTLVPHRNGDISWSECESTCEMDGIGPTNPYPLLEAAYGNRPVAPAVGPAPTVPSAPTTVPGG